VDALIAEVRQRLSRMFRNGLPGLLVVAGLGVAGVAGAAEQCPDGQQRLCVGVCFCAPGDSLVLQQANRVLGYGLRNWVVESRQRALASGASSIPSAIREQLQSYFAAQTLDAVRYRVGDDIPANLSHGLLQNPDVSAVTLVDLIVFRNAGDAQHNTALWAHELTHVEQYRELGIDGFTQLYVRDYVALESPAYQMQSRVRYALKTAAEQATLAGDRQGGGQNP
jgi:hypothetical protein